MRFTTIISDLIVKGLKALKHSPVNNVTHTNELLSSFGLDANPYPGIKGAVQPSTTNGRGAVLGFFNKFLLALAGERRMYSTDAAGNEIVTEIYQLNSGSILVRGGIVGGTEKYSMLIDSDGEVLEVTPLKTLTGNMKIIGNLEVTGNVIVGGSIIATGAISSVVSVSAPTGTFGGKDSGTHTHNYTDDGNPKVTDPPN